MRSEGHARARSAGGPGTTPTAAGARAAARRIALGALAALLALAACGRKTDVKPPQLVAPRAVTQIALTTLADGVGIAWNRPTEYVDGTNMEDLGGFVVVRSRYNEAFAEYARVQVTDRGRFQKANRFEYVDHSVLTGATYHYRVVAFTTDGYYSAASGAATITWEPAEPSPSPGATPAASRSGRPRRGAPRSPAAQRTESPDTN